MARHRLRNREVPLRFRLPHSPVAREQDTPAHDEIARQRDAPVVRVLRPEEVPRRLATARPQGHQVVRERPGARGGVDPFLIGAQRGLAVLARERHVRRPAHPRRELDHRQRETLPFPPHDRCVHGSLLHGRHDDAEARLALPGVHARDHDVAGCQGDVRGLAGRHVLGRAREIHVLRPQALTREVGHIGVEQPLDVHPHGRGVARAGRQARQLHRRPRAVRAGRLPRRTVDRAEVSKGGVGVSLVRASRRRGRSRRRRGPRMRPLPRQRAGRQLP